MTSTKTRTSSKPSVNIFSLISLFPFVSLVFVLDHAILVHYLRLDPLIKAYLRPSLIRFVKNFGYITGCDMLLKVPYMRSSEVLDHQKALSRSLVKGLLQFFTGSGDKENLGKCEQSYQVYMKDDSFVDGAWSSASVIIFFLSMQVTEFRKSLNTVNSACEEIEPIPSGNLLRGKQLVKIISQPICFVNRESYLWSKLGAALWMLSSRLGNQHKELMSLNFSISFYPLYPPAESVPLDLSLAPEALQLSLIPDVLILPSDIK
ncbi:hypothetical protein RIF29_29826 [Crotalaria pallida]|uniref:Uncharacterized protein n=1 Tax=Crotalaria pallida TaxID=3830 RepID=A0AAN9EM24_CROPI